MTMGYEKSRNQEIVEYYDNLAENYDISRFENSYGEFIDRQERIVLDLLSIDSAGTLDMPCGSGRFLNYADHGCDISQNMLKVAAKRQPGKTLTHGDARKLPYKDQSFDTVITMHLIMHLDTKTIQEITKEVHRILRPGGRWIVDIPSFKRRNLGRTKSKGWHGSTSMSINDVKSLIGNLYTIKSSYGIMMLPVHRIPGVLRKPLCRIDFMLSQLSPIKEFSSYLIYELWKS